MNEGDLIVWDKCYEVGVASIDTEHRVLVMAFNTFIKTRFQSPDAVAVDYAVSFLDGYKSYHFRNEEALMRQVHYDHPERHINDHQQLAIALDDIRADICQGRSVRDKLLLLFRNWVVKHVMEEDRDIGTYLRSKQRYRPLARWPENGAVESSDVAEVMPRSDDIKTGITDKDARLFQRLAIKLPALLIDHQGNQISVIIINISQSGALITSSSHSFRGAVGTLRLLETNIPDLDFLVVDFKNGHTSLYFTLCSDIQMVLARELSAPAFRMACLDLASPGNDDFDSDVRDGEGTAPDGHGLGSLFDL
ncbi:MAG: hemerythrin family protein [Rhodospirillaceae bacterium]